MRKTGKNGTVFLLCHPQKTTVSGALKTLLIVIQQKNYYQQTAFLTLGIEKKPGDSRNGGIEL